MKNILFVITSFRHGGTNKSLENLLSLLDTEKYQVDVFAMEHYGPYESKLPNCTILPKDKWLHALIAQFRDTKGITKLRSITLKVLRKLMTSLGMNITNKLYKKTANKLLKTKNYDAVIAYSEGVPTAFVSNVKHSNKIAWIHCDYSSYMILNNHPDEREIYASYKSIVCVSEYTKKEFVRIMPTIKEKVYAIHNLVNATEIKKLAKLPVLDTKFHEKNFTILSVGRIDVVKRFDKIPEIASILKERGVDFIWYLIGPAGFGNTQIEFEQNIKKNKVENSFIWLGAKDNPYSYMANSDLLVMTSLSEACPYVLNEAKILELPVITTDYGSATEFIDNGVNGIITPIENIANEIEKIISDKGFYKTLKQNLRTNGYENKVILDKFNALINER